MVAPTFLFLTGRWLQAIASMLLAALLPVVVARLWSIDNPALALMTMLMLPLPSFALMFATIGGVVRVARKS